MVKILLANPCINVNLVNLESKTAAEATSFPEIRKWIEMTKLKYKQHLETPAQLAKNTSLTSLRTCPTEKEVKHFSPEMKKRNSNKFEKEKYDELIKPLFKVNIFYLS